MTKIKKYKWIFISIFLVLVIFFIGEKLVNNTSSTNSVQNTNVEATEQVKKGTVTKSISATGKIETANYLSITTSVNGIVNKVYVKEGDTVTKGQKIMDITLDNEGEKSLQSAYSNYLRAKNSLNNANNSLNSLTNSLIQKEQAFNSIKESTSYSNEEERNSYKIAENDFTKAKNDLDLQKAEISQLSIALNSAYLEYQTQSPTILASDNGIIFNVVAVEGSKIENSVTSDRSVKTVASIKKQGTPIANVNVTEIDIAQIKVGQKVNLSLSSIENTKFSGEVAGVDKVGGVSSGVTNYPVIIKFSKDAQNILPNMSVSAQIIVNEKEDVLYIPNSAITNEKNNSFVTLVKSNGNKQQQIETGLVGNNETEIINGLNVEDTVLISSYPTSGFTTTSSTTRRSPGIFGIFGGR